MRLQQYLLLEQCESSISRRRLLPLLLTDGLEAALEVFFLFVQTLGPALHVLRNLTHRDFQKCLNNADVRVLNGC